MKLCNPLDLSISRLSGGLRRYLLGDESPYGQDRGGDAADDRVSEMLDVAEDELTDACVTGDLSETDEAKFVSSFPIGERLRIFSYFGFATT